MHALEIVSSPPNGRAKRSEPENWRDAHREWFNHHEFRKRGFSSSASWWRSRFDTLLNRDYKYGLTKRYDFSQILYHASKTCPPHGIADIDISVNGHLEATLDYGISLIGTLRNFDFSESYAYFSLQGLEIQSTLDISGEVGMQYQSQVLQLRMLPRSHPWYRLTHHLVDKWSPWGGSFNIKG